MDYCIELQLHDMIFDANTRYETIKKFLPNVIQDYRQENGLFHLEYCGDIGSDTVKGCLLFGEDGRLKKLTLFPPYETFRRSDAKKNGWDYHAADERYACAAWLDSVMGLADGGRYPWGGVAVLFERWSGRACVEFVFAEKESNFTKSANR